MSENDNNRSGQSENESQKRREVLKSVGSVAVSIGFYPAVSSASESKNEDKRPNGKEPNREKKINKILKKLSKADEKGKFKKEWRKLSDETQKRVLQEFETKVNIEESSDGVSLASTLDGYAKAEVYRTAPYIGRLWTYHQKVDWEYDDDADEITNLYSAAWGVVHNSNYEYLGNNTLSESGGEGEYEYHYMTQGHFQFCAGFGKGCTDNQYPYIEITADADGGSSINKGA